MNVCVANELQSGTCWPWTRAVSLCPSSRPALPISWRTLVGRKSIARHHRRSGRLTGRAIINSGRNGDRPTRHFRGSFRPNTETVRWKDFDWRVGFVMNFVAIDRCQQSEIGRRGRRVAQRSSRFPMADRVQSSGQSEWRVDADADAMGPVSRSRFDSQSHRPRAKRVGSHVLQRRTIHRQVQSTSRLFSNHNSGKRRLLPTVWAALHGICPFTAGRPSPVHFRTEGAVEPGDGLRRRIDSLRLQRRDGGTTSWIRRRPSGDAAHHKRSEALARQGGRVFRLSSSALLFQSRFLFFYTT